MLNSDKLINQSAAYSVLFHQTSCILKRENMYRILKYSVRNINNSYVMYVAFRHYMHALYKIRHQMSQVRLFPPSSDSLRDKPSNQAATSRPIKQRQAVQSSSDKPSNQAATSRPIKQRQAVQSSSDKPSNQAATSRPIKQRQAVQAVQSSSDKPSNQAATSRPIKQRHPRSQLTSTVNSDNAQCLFPN